MHFEDYETRARNYLRKTQERLVPFLKDCRIDMHEPDEQEVSVKVFGNHLDNAMGDDHTNNCGELTVVITKDGKVENFNLANLIALARLAKL